METEQKQAISLRIKQAQETLVEARLLWEHDLWRGAINRSYYAMFYAVLGLAIFKGEILSKHTHAISFFDKEFVKTGEFPKEFSRSLHYWFDERQSSDYGEITDIEQSEAQASIDAASRFVEAVSVYLSEQA